MVVLRDITVVTVTNNSCDNCKHLIECLSVLRIFVIKNRNTLGLRKIRSSSNKQRILLQNKGADELVKTEIWLAENGWSLHLQGARGKTIIKHPQTPTDNLDRFKTKIVGRYLVINLASGLGEIIVNGYHAIEARRQQNSIIIWVI